MELTRFDMQNQAIQRRIADALERLAEAVEVLASDSSPVFATKLFARKRGDHGNPEKDET